MLVGRAGNTVPNRRRIASRPVSYSPRLAGGNDDQSSARHIRATPASRGLYRKASASRLTRLVVDVNPQLGDLAVQRAEADAEAARGFLLVGESPQDALQVQPLVAAQRLSEVVDERGVVRGGGQVRREVARLHERPVTEDHRPL